MELGNRRRKILSAVVNDYVKTAEPVGSQTLAKRYNFGVRSATIRHELAAMSELGYLRQPHTSAGRVPSDLGYRYYVDQLMPAPELEPADAKFARCISEGFESEVEDILQQTCRILSSLTRYTSLATPPQMDNVTIKHIAMSMIGKRRILMVSILSTGHIDHRALDVKDNLKTSDVISFSNLLNAMFVDTDSRNFARNATQELPSDMQKFDWLYRKTVGILKQALADSSNADVLIEGATHIFRQPEFAHQQALETVCEVLEQRRTLYEILSRSLLGNDVTVVIGSENQLDQMLECSIVSASYSVGGKVCGSIGVVGPTRMDYRRAVAAVKFMSANLSDALTYLNSW